MIYIYLKQTWLFIKKEFNSCVKILNNLPSDIKSTSGNL